MLGQTAETEPISTRLRRHSVRVLYLLMFCVFLQQGPAVLAKSVRLNKSILEPVGTEVQVSLESLKPGRYYLSIGRLLTETEVRFNGSLLGKGALSLGVPLDLTPSIKSKILTITREDNCEFWRSHMFFDEPVVVAYGIGHLIQAWRSFNSIFLGPIFCLLLATIVLFSARISRKNPIRLTPHLIVAGVGLVYSLFVSGIPDLFFDQTANTFIQVLLRVAISAALILLIGAYSRPQTRLLWLHGVLAFGIVLSYYLLSCSLLWLYKIELIPLTIMMLLSTINLAQSPEGNRRADLLLDVVLVWTILQCFSTGMYWAFGPSNWTLWSPSLITLFALVDIAVIYSEMIDLSAESEIAKHSLQIAGQVAHDLRSPLAAFKNVTQRAAGLSDDEAQITRLAIKRMESIAQEVLSNYRAILNRPTQHKLEAIGLLIDNAVREKKIENPSGPSITLRYSANTEDLSATFDPAQLQRVLSNILNNACEAAGKEGAVVVEVSSSSKFVEISVSDNGIGMPEAVRQTVLVGRSATTKLEGHGIGLSYSAACIDSWRGELEIDSNHSNDNHGTIVKIRLRRN